MLPAMLAVALLLAAVLILLHGQRRPLTAGLLIAVASLAYEAVVVIGVGALILWAWKNGRSRWPAAAIATAAPMASAGYVYLRSPKRASDVVPFSNASGLFHANLGTGTFGTRGVAVVLGTLLLARMVLAVIRATLPSFRPATPGDKVILAGGALFVLGVLPFLVGGFPFATDGIFDRGNLIRPARRGRESERARPAGRSWSTNRATTAFRAPSSSSDGSG